MRARARHLARAIHRQAGQMEARYPNTRHGIVLENFMNGYLKVEIPGECVLMRVPLQDGRMRFFFQPQDTCTVAFNGRSWGSALVLGIAPRASSPQGDDTGGGPGDPTPRWVALNYDNARSRSNVLGSVPGNLLYDTTWDTHYLADGGWPLVGGGAADGTLLAYGNNLTTSQGTYTLADTTITMSGTLESGSASVQIADTSSLIVGMAVSGSGIPGGATIVEIPTLEMQCETDGTAVVTTGDTSALAFGMTVTGNGIPAGASIASVDSATEFTMSDSARTKGISPLIFGNATITLSAAATGDDAQDLTFTLPARSKIPIVNSVIHSCRTASGSKSVKVASGTTADLFAGMRVSGAGIQTGTIITATRITAACDTISASQLVTMADTSIIAEGMAVLGAGIPGGATVQTISDATHFILSAAATATGTSSLTFDLGLAVAISKAATATTTSPVNLTFTSPWGPGSLVRALSANGKILYTSDVAISIQTGRPLWKPGGILVQMATSSILTVPGAGVGAVPALSSYIKKGMAVTGDAITGTAWVKAVSSNTITLGDSPTAPDYGSPKSTTQSGKGMVYLGPAAVARSIAVDDLRGLFWIFACQGEVLTNPSSITAYSTATGALKWHNGDALPYGAGRETFPFFEFTASWTEGSSTATWTSGPDLAVLADIFAAMAGEKLYLVPHGPADTIPAPDGTYLTSVGGISVSVSQPLTGDGGFLRFSTPDPTVRMIDDGAQLLAIEGGSNLQGAEKVLVLRYSQASISNDIVLSWPQDPEFKIFTGDPDDPYAGNPVPGIDYPATSMVYGNSQKVHARGFNAMTGAQIWDTPMTHAGVARGWMKIGGKENQTLPGISGSPALGSDHTMIRNGFISTGRPYVYFLYESATPRLVFETYNNFEVFITKIARFTTRQERHMWFAGVNSSGQIQYEINLAAGDEYDYNWRNSDIKNNYSVFQNLIGSMIIGRTSPFPAFNILLEGPSQPAFSIAATPFGYYGGADSSGPIWTSASYPARPLTIAERLDETAAEGRKLEDIPDPGVRHNMVAWIGAEGTISGLYIRRRTGASSGYDVVSVRDNSSIATTFTMPRAPYSDMATWHQPITHHPVGDGSRLYYYDDDTSGGHVRTLHRIGPI